MDSAGITAFSQKMLNMDSVPAKNSVEIFFRMLLSTAFCSERLPPHADVSELNCYLLNPCFGAEACSTPRSRLAHSSEERNALQSEFLAEEAAAGMVAVPRPL